MMSTNSLLAKWFSDLVAGQVTLSTTTMLAVLFFLSPDKILQAQTPPRGDSITPMANSNTNMAKPATIVQTNFASTLRTNAAGELLIDFAMLTSYPMQIPDNLMNN